MLPKTNALSSTDFTISRQTHKEQKVLIYQRDNEKELFEENVPRKDAYAALQDEFKMLVQSVETCDLQRRGTLE